MYKQLLTSVVLAAALLGGVNAQTFSVENEEGVTIKYSVVTAGSEVEVARLNGYTGRIVVPPTVSYEGTEYSVTGVENMCFGYSTVTYVRLPETLVRIGVNPFMGCANLDSVRFDCELPPAISQQSINHVFNRDQLLSLTVIVPCGSLAMWKAAGWSLSNIKTDCAHRLTVTPTYEDIVVVDGVAVNGSLVFSSGYNEAGDTTMLAVQRAQNQMGGYEQYIPRFGYFLAWGDGSTETVRPYVMPDHDVEMECIVDTMPYATLAASRITTPVYIFSTLSYNGVDGNYHFRDKGDATTLYATGLWMGSRDSLTFARPSSQVQRDDSTTVARVAAASFFSDGTDFFPGPLRLDGTTDLETVRRFSRVWHVTREMIDSHIAHCGEDGYVIPDDIVSWPGNGADGFAEHLAPFYDADSNGRYNAHAGDYPIIRGDECVFSIFNDAFGSHSTGGEALGVEVHAMTYSFDEPEDTALWNTVFVHYDIFNRSSVDYPNTILGAWCDFDLGYAYDDFIGCDVSRSMCYAYNGYEEDTPTETSFTGVPPAQGCVILGGATMPSDGVANPYLPNNERIGMTSFMYYNNSSDILGNPFAPSDYYNYMNSCWKNYQHLKYGGNGLYATTLEASFVFPNDSDPLHWGTNGAVPEVNADDWNETTAGGAPGERRGVAGSGPFTFEAGSCQQFDIAYTAGFGETTVQSSIEAMQRNADQVRRQWGRDTTDSERPFLYMPYSAPRDVAIHTVSPTAMSVYPNPTTGLLQVMTDAGQVELMDMTGRVVATARIAAGAALLDLGSLPQGIYMLRAGSLVQRIVKR